MFELSGQMIYPHYIALLVVSPVLLVLGQETRATIVPALPILSAITISTIINLQTADLLVALFHAFHIVAVIILAGSPAPVALRYAKVSILIYAAAIFFAQALILSGLASQAEWLLILQNDMGAMRVAAFATEPAYAALTILILARFVLMIDIAWMTPARLSFILLALLATLSLFALVSAVLLLAMYLQRRGDIRAMAIVLLAGALLLVVVSQTQFFADRFSALDLARGAEGLGTGSVRLQPYIFIASILPANVIPLFVGAGAGYLEQAFFYELGNYGLGQGRLSMHMAGALYDYGLLAILPILFWWNRPANPISRALYIGMTIAVMLNTGIGSYLFVLFGTFALIEQRLRSERLGATGRTRKIIQRKAWSNASTRS